MGVEHLLAARAALRASLDRCATLSRALDAAGPRLDEIRSRLPSLVSAVRPMLAAPDAIASVPAHIDRAVGPAASVLRVFDALHGLEPSLLPPDASPLDLPSHLPLLLRLEEALRFLSSDSTSLALQWLHDILDYLQDIRVADPLFLAALRAHLPPSSPTDLDGGLLPAALDRLQTEFRRLLLLPAPASALSAVAARLAANGRLDRLTEIYADARGARLREALRGLDLAYLELAPSDLRDVQSIETHIASWGEHLEFTVRHLLEAEHRLCRDALSLPAHPDLPSRCFAAVAAHAGISAFLRFGLTVAASKKDPIKLLKLLDIFGSLNRLRLDFNRLFGGRACSDIQELTRDLIRRLVDGACEIFSELLVQVELQRDVPPPPTGAVPKLVTFVTEYCNRLLGDDYRPLLVQVLVIQRSWKKQKFHEHLLDDAVLAIVKALEQNFDYWSKNYPDDPVLSFLFMMNTHWHFFRHLRGTRLGELLGESWLREHEQYKEYYTVHYLRESWGKLPALLSPEGLVLFSGGRATARDLVKKRLKAFNHAFDEMYRRQSTWVIPDKELREKVCHLAIQAIVPAYRSYMQNYGPLVEQDGGSSGKYAKYTAQTLEQMIGALFQQRPAKSLSFKPSLSNGKPSEGVVPCQYQSAPTVA